MYIYILFIYVYIYIINIYIYLFIIILVLIFLLIITIFIIYILYIYTRIHMYSCNLGLKRFTVCDVCARMCDRSQVALFLAGGDFEASLQVDADNSYLGLSVPNPGSALASTICGYWA